MVKLGIAKSESTGAEYRVQGTGYRESTEYKSTGGDSGVLGIF